MENKENYFSTIREKISIAYEIGNRARAEGRDPDISVESLPAGDLAQRVEGLVGPEGIAKRIKELGRENIAKIIQEIVNFREGSIEKGELEKRVEQALRTSLAIVTEGVVAAPIEGISKASIKENPDGSRYLSIYYAGPIRSAGGTAQGVSAVFGDYVRKMIGLQEYRPTESEIERYVEEIKLYNSRISRLQYLPSDDEIRTIVKNLPICIDGDPTEEMEVPIHRDLPRVETNRIRGGMCLVIAEGIAQKARKVLMHASSLKLDWGWLSGLEKGEIIKTDKEIEPLKEFMSEIVGGRPIFSAPSAKGGFRLRYGKNRCSGIAAKSIHPSLPILLEGFIATGTQLKIERPGKGCVITPCETIEGPIVKLNDDSVVRIKTAEEAKKIKENVKEILFLGDILISYGDFLQTNTPLLPTGYCEEFWIHELRQRIDDEEKILNLRLKELSQEEAIYISEKFDVPLHPYYTYHWEDLQISDLIKIVNWFWNESEFGEEGFVLKNNDKTAKRILEFLGVEHFIRGDEIIVKEFLPLLIPMGIYDRENKKLKKGLFIEKIQNFSPEQNAFDFIETISPIKIRKKVGAYIGARMGRPEKAKERKLEPPVHGLFPIGNFGGKERDISIAAESTDRGVISVEIASFHCSHCGIKTIFPICQNCGENCSLRRVCPNCNFVSEKELCPNCKTTRTRYYEIQDINIRDLWKKAIDKLNSSGKVKGVIGLISEYKIPEPLEKGLLRAKNNVFIFKDGTIRYDITNVPLTHFKAKEINVEIGKLKELGYEKDINGNELKNEEQILELKVQDIIIPEKALEYLHRVSKFVDDELEKFYSLEKFYNAENKEDLLGELIVGLAPHTSVGIVGRIIGTTKANVCFAHPFWHAAKRRNADGDEDSVILLLDVLLNFSKKYLPEKRGGQMDAPLVISTILDPKEIDDEAHKIELIDNYPLEFYYSTLERKNPSDVKIKIISDILNSEPYTNLKFTHAVDNITGEILKSTYVNLKTMEEKVNSQLKVAEKIRAVNENEVAELVINSHFLRDAYGNLRTFSRQKFRCVKCNKSFRRIPLVGKCTKCGGKLLLTVPEGAIRKYLEISLKLTEKYKVSEYLKQRLMLLRREIDSLFTNELSKQIGLGEFI